TTASGSVVVATSVVALSRRHPHRGCARCGVTVGPQLSREIVRPRHRLRSPRAARAYPTGHRAPPRREGSTALSPHRVELRERRVRPAPVQETTRTDQRERRYVHAPTARGDGDGDPPPDRL